MSRDHEPFTHVIEAWLDDSDDHEDPETVLNRVIARLDATPQRPAWWPARTTGFMNNTIRTALGAAAVLVIAVVGISLLGGGRPNLGGPGPAQPTESPTPLPTPVPTSTQPAIPKAGFIGLPPPGAVSSTPEVGELVDSYLTHGGGLPFRGSVHLYADGRLIWFMYYGPSNTRSTGYLEQKLTPEGVELVRTHESLAEKDPLHLPEWLPASAWADMTIRPYVASGYAVCLMVSNSDDPFDDQFATLAEKLAMLPAAGAELLRDRAPVEGYDNPLFHCLGMTTADAWRLDAALRDAGLAQDEWRNGYLLEYHIDLDGNGTETLQLNVWFEPILPDGTIGCTSCG